MRKWQKLYIVMLLAAESTLAIAGSAAMDGLFKYHKDLASQGDPLSMYMLGNMYANGKGVARNYDAALHWYERSLENGNGNSRAALERIDEIIKKIQAAEKQKAKQNSSKIRKYIQQNKPSKGRDEIKDKANNKANNKVNNNHQTNKINTAVSAPRQSAGASDIKDIPQLKSEGQLIEEMWFEDEQQQSDADGIERPGVALIEPSAPELSDEITSYQEEDSPEPGEPVAPPLVDTSVDTSTTPAEISSALEVVDDTLSQGVETNQQSPAPTKVQDAEHKKAGFKANPCSSPAAQFMSTCN